MKLSLELKELLRYGDDFNTANLYLTTSIKFYNSPFYVDRNCSSEVLGVSIRIPGSILQKVKRNLLVNRWLYFRNFENAWLDSHETLYTSVSKPHVSQSLK